MQLIDLIPALASAELVREWHYTTGGLLAQAAIIVGIVLVNAFFVAAEFALVKVRSSQLQGAVDDGLRGAKQAQAVARNLEAYLSATQLGVTLASIALGMAGEPLVAGVIEPLMFEAGIENTTLIKGVSLTLAFGMVTGLHVVLGELTPKCLAIRKTLGMALMVAAPLHWFYVVFRPALYVLSAAANLLLKHVFHVSTVSESEMAHSEEELRHIVAESQKSKEVTETEKDILLNALALNDLCARDIMTPRNQVVSLDVDDSFETNLKVAIESKHTRFPLVEGHLDQTIGLIHIKDLLRLVKEANPDLKKIRRDIVPVPEMMPIDKLLRVFLEKHAHLALAVDEYGGAVGIVTLDNVVEEIVGDIQDEFDSEKPEFHRISDDEFTVEGTLNLYELAELAGIEIESEEVTTIGGYVTHLIGHLPKPGEKTVIEDFEVTATKTDQRRVQQLHFKRKPKSAATEEKDAAQDLG
ncbi:MAG: hemolysin family protein [Verrucomicrobiaceae bacterium]|nr:hemolysin family protein [Verrucomicrobiaceae bacterium]